MAAIVGGFASGLAVQLSSSRLLYSMGRDGVLPRRIFGALHPRTQTPVLSLLLTGAMCLTGLDIGLQTATSFINFGAFTAFTAVNVCVVLFYLRNRNTSGGVLGYVVAPSLGACVTTYRITQLSADALTIGLVWLAAGCGYLLWLTRGLRRPIPELVLADERAPAGS